MGVVSGTKSDHAVLRPLELACRGGFGKVWSYTLEAPEGCQLHLTDGWWWEFENVERNTDSRGCALEVSGGSQV